MRAREEVSHRGTEISPAVRCALTLRVGDLIHICGHTTDFRQKVESLEVASALTTEVGTTDDFGLKVVGTTRVSTTSFSKCGRDAPDWTRAMEARA